MLILYSILAALLWGSLIGGSLHRGDPMGKVHLARGHLIIGAVLFTIPAVATLIKSPVTQTGLITAVCAAAAAFIVGIRVGISTYWVD